MLAGTATQLVEQGALGFQPILHGKHFDHDSSSSRLARLGPHAGSAAYDSQWRRLRAP